MLVSVIIVSARCDFRLIRTIYSLGKSVLRDFEIVIVDNGSPEGALQAYETACRLQLRCKVIHLDRNLGPVIGYNLGIKGSSSEIIALLHDDVVLSPLWLDRCVNRLLVNVNYAAVQGKIYQAGGQHVLDSCGCVIDSHGCEHDRGQGERDEGQYNKECEVFSVSGVASVFRKSVIESVGYFDENFFSGLDDLDLCWRARLRGFRIIYTPDAIAYHERSRTWKSTSELQRKIVLEFAKTRIYVPFKNFEIGNFFRSLPVILLHFLGGFFLNLAQGDMRIASCYPYALYWFLANLRKFTKERIKVQLKIRKVKDEKILPMYTRSCNLIDYTIRRSLRKGYKRFR